MNGLIFDTEVNSLEHMEPVEVAHCVVSLDDGVLSAGPIITNRYKPSQAFEIGAISVHLIIPEDVVDCDASDTATIPITEYVIGHNVDFDMNVMKIDGPKRICTLAICRHLWPETKSHTLTAMFLSLMFVTRENIERVRSAHAADADVMMTSDILRCILALTDIQTFEELYVLSERSRIPTHMPYGKHKGELLSKVPRDYKQWLLKQSDVDPYLRKALQDA